MAALTPGDRSLKRILEIHRLRHPDHTEDRVRQEVKDFLRRSSGLEPDIRKIEDGGLAGLTTAQARNCAMLVMRNTTDITKLYR
ncbi:MAG TPA: hypothetical protein VKU80_17550 [Planctomycetota bacterium]|nr:hypothetical protein [Planctomycetota bacterium]